MSGLALSTGSSWGTCILYLIFAWQNCSTVQHWDIYITLPWLPVRYHYLGHAYTVSLRFSRWKPGHWWWQLELPEMLILERLVLEMSILEKLGSAEQEWRCRSQCSLESRSNRPWQIGKSPAGLFWTWHGHGKEKQGRVVGAAEMGNGWKWNLVSPGGTLSQIHPKQEILLPLSLVMFGGDWSLIAPHAVRNLGSLSPAIRQHLPNLFNLGGLLWPGSWGFQTSHFQRLSDKGTNETHHVFLEYLGVMRFMFYGKCNLPEWTLVEQLWCRETRQADIKSNAGYKATPPAQQM